MLNKAMQDKKMQPLDGWMAAVVSVLIALAAWYGLAHPRTLSVEWPGTLKSASFAPFRDGQTPLKEIFPTPEQIEEDLVLLKGTFDGVRTYTSLGGMEVVPALAAKHGLTLTHSAWIGREAARNNQEVDALIDTANHYPEAVKRVIVGNEVLLRQDLKPDELIAYIDRVRHAVKQPVSYADVWAFWLKYPQVAEHVDYITIHILPYWEDEPVSVEHAQQHLLANIDRIKQAFPGKPILVGETGWPTEGRSRGPAAADMLVAAEFARRLPALAAANGFDYNLVEAFDQTWKARQEGTVGARWGVYDSDRQQKYGLTGAVNPVPNAFKRAGVSILLGILFAIALVPLCRTRRAALAVALCTQLLGAALVESVYSAVRLTISPASFTWMQQHILFAMADHGWLSEATVGIWYKRLLQDQVEPLALVWGWSMAFFAIAFTLVFVRWTGALLMGTKPDAVARLVRSGFGFYALGAMVFALIFVTSGRYMDMPVSHFWLPLVAALTLGCIRCLQLRVALEHYAIYTRCTLFNRHAVWLLPLAALACIWGEVGAMLGGSDFIAMHPTLALQVPLIARSIVANHELMFWCVMCVLLAVPFRIGSGIQRRAAAM